jgi:hypothetical protein
MPKSARPKLSLRSLHSMNSGKRLVFRDFTGKDGYEGMCGDVKVHTSAYLSLIEGGGRT